MLKLFHVLGKALINYKVYTSCSLEELGMFNHRTSSVVDFGRQPDLCYPKQSFFTEDDVYFFGVIQLQPQRARQIVMKNSPSNEFWNLPSVEKAAYLYYFTLYGQYTLKSIKQYHNIFNKEFFKYAVDGDSTETSLIKICKHTRDEYDTRPQPFHQQAYDPSLRSLFRDRSVTSVSHSTSFCDQQRGESDTVLNSKMLDDLCYLGDHLHSSAKQTAEFSHEPSQQRFQQLTPHHFAIHDHHQPLSVLSQPPELYHNHSPQQKASNLKENGGGFLNGINTPFVNYVQPGSERKFSDDRDPNKFGFDESLGRSAGEERVEEFASPPPSKAKIATVLNDENYASALSSPVATIETYHKLPSQQLFHPPTEPHDQLHSGAEDPSTEPYLAPSPSRNRYHAEHHDDHERHSLLNQQTEVYHNLAPPQEEASLKENGGGFLNGLTKKLSKYIPTRNEMKLPHNSDPNKFRFDEYLGRWVGEGVEEAPAPPPPPPSAKTATMLDNRNIPAASLTLSNAGNDATVTSSHVPSKASFRRNAGSRYANPFSLASSPAASPTLPPEEFNPPIPTTIPQFYM